MVAAVEPSGSGSSSVGNECQVAVPRHQVVVPRGAAQIQNFGSACSLWQAAKLSLFQPESLGASRCNSNLQQSLGLVGLAGCGLRRQGVISGLLA